VDTSNQAIPKIHALSQCLGTHKANRFGITSGNYFLSNSLTYDVNGPVAMGYVENEFSKKNTKVFLEVRGKKHPASICSLPFYKKSYVKGVN